MRGIDMKLSECKHGTLVQSKDSLGEIGMIVGITNDIASVLSEEQRNPERAIPLVQWQSGHTCGIHHENIKVFKG
jgi:hypothetical protein